MVSWKLAYLISQPRTGIQKSFLTQIMSSRCTSSPVRKMRMLDFYHFSLCLVKNWPLDYNLVHKDFLDMNVSWLSEDLELIEYHSDIFTSSIFTVARVITLAMAIIVHRAFYKLMKRLPGRAVNTIIYPNMVRCIHSFFSFSILVLFLSLHAFWGKCDYFSIFE